MKELKSLPRLIAAQDWPAAERVLRRRAKASPRSPEVFYNLAKVLEAAGKTDQIQHWLERAVAANPGYGIAWFELGRIALEKGALEAAHRAFQKAADLMPSDAIATRNLGRLALRLGHWEQAHSCFASYNDQEAQLACYRIAAETGTNSIEQRNALLAQSAWRPEVLKTLTRTSKGSITLGLRPPVNPAGDIASGGTPCGSDRVFATTPAEQCGSDQSDQVS